MSERSGRRTQWVFTRPCGCPDGVLEGNSAASRSAAFREMYPGGIKDRDAALDRGVTARLVPHEEYVSRYMPMMMGEGCPHGAER